MGSYLIRRVVLAIPTILGVVLAVFLLIRFVPGDVVSQLIGLEGTISPTRVGELRKLFGLDKPLPVQFAEYMTDVARGDLGKFMSQVPTTSSGRPRRSFRRNSGKSGSD